MYVEQGEMFDGLIAAGFTPTQVSALRGIFTQCMLKHVSRGQLSLHGSRPDGATDAVLSLANFPPTGEITDSAVPDSEGEMRNGWALDVVFGAVRFGGAVVFDGPVVDNGGTVSQLPIGTIVLWGGSIGSIPTGWALMDGTANASGTGIDMRGMVPYGYSGSGDFATIGGSIAVALATSFSGSGTANTSNGGSHNHEITGTQIATAISISAHTGSGSANTGGSTASLTPSPTVTDFSEGSSYTIYLWPTSGSSPSVASHTHTIGGSDVAGLLGSHTVSTTASNAETLSAADHNHTVTISNIASGLSIGTPTTVRTPGKVLAYIEKVA